MCLTLCIHYSFFYRDFSYFACMIAKSFSVDKLLIRKGYMNEHEIAIILSIKAETSERRAEKQLL